MENNQRNSRKRLNSLILLVAFTAVMLIISTYAWFSAQKTVLLGGLQGKVKVAEGLEISLDAKHWSQEVDFKDYAPSVDNQSGLERLYGITASGQVTGHTKDDGNLDTNDVVHNLIPTELLPVSTTGKSGDGIGQTDMNFYRGTVESKNGQTDLKDITVVQKSVTAKSNWPIDKTKNPGDEDVTVGHQDYPGYYAIDFFLKNSTGTTVAGTNTGFTRPLQLNYNSKLELLNAASLTTGLQNTVRVAFAMFNTNTTDSDADNYNGVAPGVDGQYAENSDTAWAAYLANPDTLASNHMSASQSQILNAYYGQTIRDVAIWEPNASDHVEYIYQSVAEYAKGSYPLFSVADSKLYMEPTWSSATGVKGMRYDFGTPAAEKQVGAMRTYALTSTAAGTTKLDGKTLTKIYDWSAPSTGLVPQVTLQTEKVDDDDYTLVDGVKNLVSVNASNEFKYALGNETGTLAAGGAYDVTTAHTLNMQDGTVCKVRMYVWLEGQDVDTINHASHGGGVYMDIGLLKDGTPGES